MKRYLRHILGLIIAIMVVYLIVFRTDLFIKETPSVDYSDKLPVSRIRDVKYGKVNKYYPGLFYKKYRLSIVKNWKTVSESNTDYSLFTDYYLKGYTGKDIADSAQKLIIKDNAESYVLFETSKNIFLLTIKEQIGPGTQYSDIEVKLYLYKDKEYGRIYQKRERYSRDPGYESNFFVDRLRLFIYKLLSGDTRYD